MDTKEAEDFVVDSVTHQYDFQSIVQVIKSTVKIRLLRNTLNYLWLRTNGSSIFNVGDEI